MKIYGLFMVYIFMVIIALYCKPLAYEEPEKQLKAILLQYTNQPELSRAIYLVNITSGCGSCINEVAKVFVTV